MSYIVTCIQVALVIISDVQSILDIPATDQIHIWRIETMVSLNQAEQWHIHHAKQSIALRANSYI